MGEESERDDGERVQRGKTKGGGGRRGSSSDGLLTESGARSRGLVRREAL